KRGGKRKGGGGKGKRGRRRRGEGKKERKERRKGRKGRRKRRKEKREGGGQDDGDVASEYWKMVERRQARHSEGGSQLKKMNASAPGNVSLRKAMARQRVADEQQKEGL
ncbi:hypothetical protein ACQJ0S_25650, partial [Klebsiella pneumoniae]|uniref:hypothetical protein n=1 Tax=Klebsiella pneumoniae TaxID=573 RepID=UPI003D01AF96